MSLKSLTVSSLGSNVFKKLAVIGPLLSPMSGSEGPKTMKDFTRMNLRF
jgi:hypothetical protein